MCGVCGAGRSIYGPMYGGQALYTEVLPQPSVLVHLSPSCPIKSAVSCRGLVVKCVLTFISFRPNRQLEVSWETEEQGSKG